MRFMVYTRNIKDFHLIMIWKLPGPWIQFIIQKLLHTVYKSLQSSGSFQQVFNVLGQRPEFKNPFRNFRGGIWATGSILTFAVASPASRQDKVSGPLPQNFLLPGWKSSLWNESALTPALGFILVLNQLGQFITNTQCCSGTRCTSTTN